MKNKTTVIAAIVLVVLLVAASLCWNTFKPESVDGVKNITVDVVHGDGSVNTFEIETEQEHLYDALAEKGIVGTLDNGYFTELDGEVAVTEEEQWWGYTKSGEYVSYGVGECVIEDGDHYEFTFNVGW